MFSFPSSVISPRDVINMTGLKCMKINYRILLTDYAKSRGMFIMLHTSILLAESGSYTRII